MSTSRQLAAIMFTDIVSYTALMGKDSDKALELVRISKDVQKPLVEQHNGKWLKGMGDGALVKFGTLPKTPGQYTTGTLLNQLSFY